MATLRSAQDTETQSRVLDEVDDDEIIVTDTCVHGPQLLPSAHGPQGRSMANGIQGSSPAYWPQGRLRVDGSQGLGVSDCGHQGELPVFGKTAGTSQPEIDRIDSAPVEETYGVPDYRHHSDSDSETAANTPHESQPTFEDIEHLDHLGAQTPDMPFSEAVLAGPRIAVHNLR